MNCLEKYGCHLFFSSLVLSTALTAQDQEQVAPISPEVVEAQLQTAEELFKKAKEMFNPWYTGPLLTPSYSTLSQGTWNVQPYLFVTDNYARFDKHGKSHDIFDLLVIKTPVFFQYGIADWVNGTFTPQLIRNRQHGHYSVSFGDTSVGLNFRLLKETNYYPGMSMGISESFPSGVYQKLNPEKGGVDATGSGSYATNFSFNIGKVIWWWFPKHPMRFRLSLNYQVFSHVRVRDFNAYGGGFGTRGSVHPGGTFSADFGYEFSFNQNWVFALDAVYAYSSKTTFSGHHGLNASGAPATVGGPFNDQLSLAPAIEYNVNPNLGFIAGVWFSPWGRNSLDFVSGVFSFTYTF